jgi:hypothetical protein
MKQSEVIPFVVLIWLANAATAGSPGNAPALPITGVRVVHVSQPEATLRLSSLLIAKRLGPKAARGA